MEEEKTCCICGKKCESKYGNIAYPVSDNGVCCDNCNWTIVMPKRIELALREGNKYDR